MHDCPDCERSFKSKQGLSGHLRVHNGVREAVALLPYVCLNCGKPGTYRISSANGKYCSARCKSDHDWVTTQIPKIEAGGGGNLRKYLTEKRGYQCEWCSTSSWRNEPITLHVDHIDGNSDNNLPANVRFLCPNCHSQTHTYTGRNIKNTKRNRYLQIYKAEKKQKR